MDNVHPLLAAQQQAESAVERAQRTRLAWRNRTFAAELRAQIQRAKDENDEFVERTDSGDGSGAQGSHD